MKLKHFINIVGFISVSIGCFGQANSQGINRVKQFNFKINHL